MAVETTGVEFVAKGFEQLMSKLNQMDAKIDQTGLAADKAGGFIQNTLAHALGNILVSAATLAVNALSKIGQELIQIGREALTAVADYEKLSMSLQTLSAREMIRAGTATTMAEAMELSGDKAKELLDWIQRLAIESPFTQEGVAVAFRTAMAYGFTSDEAQRLTQAMIDFSAGSGAAEGTMNMVALALGQIKAKGKLAGQEVLQLVNAGLNVRDALLQAGTVAGLTAENFDEMQSKGLIPADLAIQAITETLERDFGGAAKRQAGTFAGLISSLQDIKTVGLREFFSGTFEAVQPLLDTFVATLSSPEFMASLGNLGDAIGEVAALLLSGFSGDLPTILEDVTGFFDRLGEAMSGVREVGIVNVGIEGAEVITETIEPAERLKNIMAVFGIDPAIVDTITNIATRIGEIVEAAQGGDAANIMTALGLSPEMAQTIIDTVDRIKTVITDLFTGKKVEGANPFQESFGEQRTGGILENIQKLSDSFGKLVDWFTTNWPKIQAVAQTAWRVISSIALSIADVIVNKVWPELQNAFASITETLDSFGISWDDVGRALGVGAAIIGAIFLALIGIVVGVITGVSGMIKAIVTHIQNLAENLKGIVEGIAQWVGGAMEIVGGLLGGDFERVKNGFINAWEGIWNTVTSLVTSIVDGFIGPFKILWGFISGFVDGVVGFFKTLYEKLVGGSIIPEMMTAIYNTIVTWITNAVTWLESKIDGLVLWITTTATNIYNSIVTFLGDMLTAVTEKIVEIYDTVVQWISDLQTWWETTWATIKTWLTTTLADMLTTVIEKMQKIYNSITEKIAAIGQWFTDKYNEFIAWGKKVVDGIKAGLQDLLTNNPIIKAVSDAVAALTEWMGGETILAKLASIGSGIIDGMLTGIENNVEKLISYLRGKVADIIDAVLESFGFGSPSKPFRDIGQRLVGSLQIGLDDMMPSLTSQVSAMVTPLIQMMQPAASSTANYYYSTTSNREYNLTTQSLLRPGGLAAEFDTMSLVGR